MQPLSYADWRMTNEEVARRYSEAIMALDFDTLAKLRDPNWYSVWPQSGEIVRGSDNNRKIMDSYPGGAPRRGASRARSCAAPTTTARSWTAIPAERRSCCLKAG